MTKHKITFDYESKHQPVHPLPKFLKRLGKHILLALVLTLLSLLIGIFGYHYFENFTWIDSLLNASMILGGMGPVNTLTTEAGKLFASLYALYSGIFVLASAGIILAPIAHRILHHFHADVTDK